MSGILDINFILNELVLRKSFKMLVSRIADQKKFKIYKFLNLFLPSLFWLITLKNMRNSSKFVGNVIRNIFKLFFLIQETLTKPRRPFLHISSSKNYNYILQSFKTTESSFLMNLF